jgi:hypothetical protein
MRSVLLTVECSPCCMTVDGPVAQLYLSTCLGSQHCSADTVVDPAVMLRAESPILHTSPPHTVNSLWSSSVNLDIVHSKTGASSYRQQSTNVNYEDRVHKQTNKQTNNKLRGP